jgi:hypothetical protein
MNPEDNKRLLEIPVDKLRITPGGRLDYPDCLPVCTKAAYITKCMRCKLIVSTSIYFKSLLIDNKENRFLSSKLFTKCENQECSEIFTNSFKLNFFLEHCINLDVLLDLDMLIQKDYDKLFPVILDMYDNDYNKEYENNR